MPMKSGRVASAWPSLIAAGPSALERAGIVGHRRRAGAEPRQPRDPPQARRRGGTGLDPAQRAVRRQYPPPAQQPPDVDDGRGHAFQPLWIATSPPRIGRVADPREARRVDHRRELGHRREAADAFDEVAIRLLVLGNVLADLRHDAVRIGVVERRDAGPLHRREFEADRSARRTSGRGAPRAARRGCR